MESKLSSDPYCRRLEDGSGFVVVKPIIKYGTFHASIPYFPYVDKWEIVLGLGKTKAKAIADACLRKEGVK